MRRLAAFVLLMLAASPAAAQHYTSAVSGAVPTGGTTWQTLANFMAAYGYGTGPSLSGSTPFVMVSRGSVSSLPDNMGIGFGANAVVEDGVSGGGGQGYDTGFGYFANHALTTGDHTTALGSYACMTLATSSHNSCLGIDTLRYVIDTSQWNTILGEQAGNYGSSAAGGTINYGTYVGANAGSYAGGSYNSFLGYQSGLGSSAAPITGNGNSGFGAFTLAGLNGTAANNTALGYESSGTLSTGNANTTVGGNSGFGLTTGSNNVLLGQGAGNTFPTTGSFNVLISGNSSTATGATSSAVGIGESVRPGSDDVALGQGALNGTTTDSLFNVGIGYLAGIAITSGAKNLCVGFEACQTVTTGYYNIALGSGAGTTTLTTGHDNILIGTGGNPANTAAAATSNYLSIGGEITGTLGTNIAFSHVVLFRVYTVATLPAAPGAGAHAYVGDATACSFGGSLTGGGSIFCPVSYNGSAWIVG